ncbi:MAG: transcription-repair coupling factor, partial [Clostridia bacterium]|nr:transcription-repair coupling factor [Clostridia bacterium]
MENLSDIIYRLPEYKSLEKAVSENRSSAATGLTGIHKANVITALCRRLSKKALVLVGEEQEAVALMSDTSAMGLNALFYPIRDFSFREMTGKSREYEHKRLMVLSNVLKGNYDVVFATIDAAAQFTMPPETLKRSSYTLKVGAKAEISEIAAVLQASGYERYE